MNTLETRLQAIESRVRAATPGPWALYRDPAKIDQMLVTAQVLDIGPSFNYDPAFVEPQTEVLAKVSYQFEDAELIAHCPTDLAALCRALRVAMEALDQLSGWELHFGALGGLFGEAQTKIFENISNPVAEAKARIKSILVEAKCGLCYSGKPCNMEGCPDDRS